MQLILGLHGVGEAPVALGAPWVEANDLPEEIGRLINVAVKYQGVREIHHVARLARHLFIHSCEEGLGGFVFAQLVEHGAGKIQDCRVRGLNAPHFFQGGFSEGDATFAGVEARQLRPGSRMIAVDLDHGFERVVGHTTLVALHGHQANQKMRGGEVGALGERALAGLGRDIQLAAVQAAVLEDDEDEEDD